MKQKIYNKSKDKHLTEAIQKQLQASQVNGMVVGAKSICSVVMKKIEFINAESSKDEMLDAIEKVRAFCNVPLTTDSSSKLK